MKRVRWASTAEYPRKQLVPNFSFGAKCVVRWTLWNYHFEAAVEKYQRRVRNSVNDAERLSAESYWTLLDAGLEKVWYRKEGRQDENQKHRVSWKEFDALFARRKYVFLVTTFVRSVMWTKNFVDKLFIWQSTFTWSTSHPRTICSSSTKNSRKKFEKKECDGTSLREQRICQENAAALSRTDWLRKTEWYSNIFDQNLCGIMTDYNS